MNINQYRAVQAYVDVQLAYMALCEGTFAKAGDPPRRRGRGGAL